MFYAITIIDVESALVIRAGDH